LCLCLRIILTCLPACLLAFLCPFSLFHFLSSHGLSVSSSISLIFMCIVSLSPTLCTPLHLFSLPLLYVSYTSIYPAVHPLMTDTAKHTATRCNTHCNAVQHRLSYVAVHIPIYPAIHPSIHPSMHVRDAQMACTSKYERRL